MVVVLAGGCIILISMGLRQSFGIFMQPFGCVLGIDRESFGLAIALQNLMLGLPLAGPAVAVSASAYSSTSVISCFGPWMP